MNDMLLYIGGALFMFAAAFSPKKSREKLKSFFGLPDNYDTSIFEVGDSADQGTGSFASGYAPASPSYTSRPTVDQTDLDTLARTIWGEARGESYRGMQAVANVVMNRYRLGNFGGSIAAVCRKPNQFSAWNSNDPNYPRMLTVNSTDPKFKTALQIAEKALLGILPDVTGGADHYLNITVTKKIRGGTLPSWVDMSKKTTAIGSHTFLKLA